MPNRTIFTGVLPCLLVAALQLQGQPSTLSFSRPNILFIVLDDVGKDQLAAFNPSANTAALTPNINTIISQGVKFTNFYTMPECSPSRAAFFTGRYPLRTGVTAAILTEDLPAAQVSPSEATTPRVLETAGYNSALFGKYHLGGPENNPDGNSAPLALGWHYFNGNLRGGPAGIDWTLGGQYKKDQNKYSCGFPLGALQGAVWFQGNDGKARCDDKGGEGYNGLAALTLGGIPVLDSNGNYAPTCREAVGSGADFTIPNGYYVWPQVVADSRTVQATRSRQYMTSAQTDAALEWIKGQPQGNSRPWMATVAYNSIHTPYQQPPADLIPKGFVWPPTVSQNCNDPAAQRVLGQLMLASVDKEIGRLLVSAGLAKQDERGLLVYKPSETNTMVVIVGDNGSFIPSVLPPYDSLRSKGTPYETGVLAPLIVAGPLVSSPGRSVDKLVNCVDLFQLFAEIAGINVRTAVPRTHELDSKPVLPYLMNPGQPAVRRYNFTQLGTGLKPPSVKLWPCVIPVGAASLSSDILFNSQSLCEGTGGVWYGPTAAAPTPLYPNSCAIKQASLYKNLTILPNQVWALRNERYKLVKVDRPSCETNLGEFEFYDLLPNASTNPAGLDPASGNLLTNGQPVNLTADQTANFGDLAFELTALLNSETVCYGDGNLDKRVNVDDLRGVLRYQGLPSVFDFTQDGVTDMADFRYVLANIGNNCLARGSGGRPR